MEATESVHSVLAKLTATERRRVEAMADRAIADVAIAEGVSPAAIYMTRLRIKQRLGRPLAPLRLGRRAK